MKTTMTFEINRHERAAIRTHLAAMKTKGAEDDGSVEMFIEHAFQSALQNLMYQGFIEQAFRDALMNHQHENSTRAHAAPSAHLH